MPYDQPTHPQPRPAATAAQHDPLVAPMEGLLAASLRRARGETQAVDSFHDFIPTIQPPIIIPQTQHQPQHQHQQQQHHQQHQRQQQHPQPLRQRSGWDQQHWPTPLPRIHGVRAQHMVCYMSAQENTRTSGYMTIHMHALTSYFKERAGDDSEQPRSGSAGGNITSEQAQATTSCGRPPLLVCESAATDQPSGPPPQDTTATDSVQEMIQKFACMRARTGNQAELVPQYLGEMEKAVKGRQQPLKMWVVLKTLRIPLANPASTLMLDGRHTIRLLRKKATTFVFDKTAKFFRCDTDGKWVATNVWTPYHMAFLISTDATWVPLENMACSYVTNAKASRQTHCQPMANDFQIFDVGSNR